MVSNPNEEAENQATTPGLPARAIVLPGTPTYQSDNGNTHAEQPPIPVRPAGSLNTQPADPSPDLAADPSHVEEGETVPPTEQRPTYLSADPSPVWGGEFATAPAPAAPAPMAASPQVFPTTAQMFPASAEPAHSYVITPAMPVAQVMPVEVLTPTPSPHPPIQAPQSRVQNPPSGALVLLAGEEVIMQLGALYLTNRRTILYAPAILRAAFLKDVDAVGTVTERSGGLMLILGLLGIGLAALAAYTGITQPSAELGLGDLYHAPPLLVAAPLALLGLLALASYFFWVKRSLFLSVGGRPLIVVSISGWSSSKLAAVDSFVNAFSMAKDRDGAGRR